MIAAPVSGGYTRCAGARGINVAVFSMSDEDIRSALKELDLATYNHLQWAEALNSTLICRTTPDSRDISEDAHHNCQFGQWYDKAGYGALNRIAGFEGMGVEHERMHQSATVLLHSLTNGTQILAADYQRFVAALKQLQLQISVVHRELTDALLNLDPLTGVPNRSKMMVTLREQHTAVKNHARSCVLAMMDLDHFKSVNDKHGHGVGDRVLIAIARYVMEHLRPDDRIFRYGGEEFLLLFPDTTLREANAIAERLRTELASLRHRTHGEDIVQLTVSFGLSPLAPDAPAQVSVDHADKALYAAKVAGRNCTVIWDASMH